MTQATTKEEYEKMATMDLLDELIDLARGDMWDGFMSKTCRNNYVTAKEVLDVRIKSLEADANIWRMRMAQTVEALNNNYPIVTTTT